MGLLYFLEEIRIPVLNEFMLLITTLGEETAFLVAAMIVFWCVNKRYGYYMIAVGFMGTLVNQILKLTFCEPRPWVIDPDFTTLEQARKTAVGFSLPSGHSTSAVGTFGSIAAFTDKNWIKNTCIAVCVLVPFSRMYVGVHTLADVLSGAAIALLLVWTLRPMCWQELGGRKIMDLWTMMIALAFTLLLFVWLDPFQIPQDQRHNLLSGSKNAYTMIGSIAGIMVVYPLEKKYVNFDTKAKWWVQILKILLGFALVLAVKEGLRAPLDALFMGHMAARAVRYFLIVIVAGLIWPMSFRRLSKLGAKK